MKIALVGASGFVGSAVLEELLSRGHAVTALVRRAGRLPEAARLQQTVADAEQPDAVAAAVRGHDAVISAFNPGWGHPDLYARFLAGARGIVAGTRQAGVPRLLVVGGAGSLYVAPGVQLVDTPEFAALVPPSVLPGAKAARDALTDLRAETVLDWVFLSPPGQLQPGERSGRYRLGEESLLMDGAAPAGISVRDLAVAIVDEIETPRHHRTRFTVASELTAG